MTKKFFPSAVLALLLLPSLSAQQTGPTAPAETSIEVPELFLRVEELELEEVDAVLPEPGDLALGQVEAPLPGADDLEIDQAAFVVRPPGASVATGGSSIFVSGELGAGSASFILGELELFRLGLDPRFRVRFRHQGIDGFAFNEPGAGFFFYENVIDGALELGDAERAALEVDAGFSEEVTGLQGQSDFYSVGIRSTRAELLARLQPDPLVTLEPSIAGALTSRINADSGASSQAPQREVVIAPAVAGSVAIRDLRVLVETDYESRFTIGTLSLPTRQLVQGIVGAEITLADLYDVSARAGVSWEPSEALRYPWSVELAGAWNTVELQVGGGYRVESISLGSLWSELPTLAAGDSSGGADLRYNPQWYAEADASWFGGGPIGLGAGLAYVSEEAGVEVAAYDPVADEFPFTQIARSTVTGNATLTWRPASFMSLRGGWTGRFLDLPNGAPGTALNATLVLSDASERLSADITGSLGFYPEFVTPAINVSSTYAPSPELEFVFRAHDLLAPLMEDGRPSFGADVTSDYPYIEPGFRAEITARISL